MTQHTPFPWRLEISEDQTQGDIYGPNGEHVENADLGGTFLLGGKEEFERELGDLRLKAAAPTMLDALETVREFQKDRLISLPESIVQAVNAAIKRARGPA